MDSFFSYFGGKGRLARVYDPPEYKTVIEPFAGAAGYSTLHYTNDVILVDKYPVIAAIWKYLIEATPEEILELPDVLEGYTVNDLDVCDGARLLIGFWLSAGSATPRQTPSAWMREEVQAKADTQQHAAFWGPRTRERLARQVPKIKHWKIIEGDYTNAPDIEATWYIDPPYIAAGKDYKHSSYAIDYQHLAEFCRTRKGQVMVCENEGATWLPFQPFIDGRGTSGKVRTGITREVIWKNSGFSLFD